MTILYHRQHREVDARSKRRAERERQERLKRAGITLNHNYRCTYQTAEGPCGKPVQKDGQGRTWNVCPTHARARELGDV